MSADAIRAVLKSKAQDIKTDALRDIRETADRNVKLVEQRLEGLIHDWEKAAEVELPGSIAETILKGGTVKVADIDAQTQIPVLNLMLDAHPVFQETASGSLWGFPLKRGHHRVILIVQPLEAKP